MAAKQDTDTDLDLDISKADISKTNANSQKDSKMANNTNDDEKEKSTLPTLTSKKIQMDVPWLEKYRPKHLDDVVGNQETIARLRVISRHGNLPNLIISGPPGTGKTTSIHCLALGLLGPVCYKTAVLELNASDDRGIDVVRNKIKMFAQQKVTLPRGRHKVVILDEADNMTQSAQQALRRTMELYSSTTRFALACNISSKIIEPIQSRCAILRYTRLKEKEVLTRVKQILDFEKISAWTAKGLEAIVFISDGDMRNAINSLQATASGFGNITDGNVYKVCDVPHPVAVREILASCNRNDISEAILRLKALLKQGFSTIDFISTLFRVTKTYAMNEQLKLDWIKEMGFIHARIADGLDSELQLSGLLAKMCLAKSGKSQDWDI